MTGTVERRVARSFGAALLALSLLLGHPWPSNAASPDASVAPAAGHSLVRVEYGADVGARLSSADGQVTLTAPAGAAAERAVFSHQALSPPTGTGRTRIARAFRLEAFTSSENRPVTHFARPLQLVVRYTAAEL